MVDFFVVKKHLKDVDDNANNKNRTFEMWEFCKK